VLPKGFVRIRHFGFLSTRRRAALLPLCFQLLGASSQSKRGFGVGVFTVLMVLKPHLDDSNFEVTIW
jgi:hypothetical protein